MLRAARHVANSKRCDGRCKLKRREDRRLLCCARAKRTGERHGGLPRRGQRVLGGLCRLLLVVACTRKLLARLTHDLEHASEPGGNPTRGDGG